MSIEGNSNVESTPPATSQENEGESRTNFVESIMGSIEVNDIPSTHSLEFSAPQMIDSSLEHKNGGSVTTTNIQVNGTMPSNISSVASTEEEKIDNHEQSDEPTEHHVEVPIVSSLAHRRTLSDVPTKHLVEIGTVPTKTHKRTSSEHEIDTAAPIESVKEAVSKFGGIIDWKAHKVQTEEKGKFVEVEVEKAQDEMSKYKKQLEAAKDAKDKTLDELDSTKRLIEELKLNLERAQNEEQQAKQDSHLAKLMVEEVQQGIADDASAATNAEFEVAQARHAAAVAELKSVKDELEKLHVEYSSLIVEKNLAVQRAEEALSASMEVEKTLEDLTLELIAVKGSLESAHAAHLEAEEERLRADIAKAEDSSNWEKELKEAEVDLQKLNQQYLSEKEIKLKLGNATTLLHDLKAELEAYKEGKPNPEKHAEEGNLKANQEDKNQSASHEEITTARKELEEVSLKIEKAIAHVNYLKVASASLQSELEREKLAVSTIKQREGIASVTVASLEADINKILTELELIYAERARKENIVEGPNQINQAKQEMEQSKSLALLAQEEMSKAKEEGELVKAGVFTIDRRIHAAQKEIEAAQASERLAWEAVKALEESESVGSNGDENASKRVTISFEEYRALSKKACDMEEKAKLEVAAAISKIEEAMDSELRSLERLEEVNKEKAAKKEELRVAMENAEKAKDEKLAIEQELRKRRTENELRRRASDVGQGVSDFIRSLSSIDEKKRFERSSTAPVQTNPEDLMLENCMETDSSSETEVVKKKKKKRSLFPRIVMFLARRKVQVPKAV